MSKRKKNFTIKIKAEDIKVSIGHQKHQSGVGAHDLRPKRQRTRSAQRRAAMKEWH